MKKAELVKTVKQNFKISAKLFRKVITDFDVADINEFRTGIKKLRSFFHLVDMEFSSGFQIKMSKKMKTFYGYAGIIRNLKLHLKNINDYCQNSGSNPPKLYLVKLNEEIKNWEKNTTDFMDIDNNFLNDEERILNELPEKLTKESIKKFLDYIFYEITPLLTRSDEDEVLLSIRKFLQDIFYNWPYIKRYISVYPSSLWLDEKRNECLTLLGAFRDKCIDVTLLQTYSYDLGESEENKQLDEIEKIWKNEKQELRKINFDELALIKFSIRKVKMSSFTG